MITQTTNDVLALAAIRACVANGEAAEIRRAARLSLRDVAAAVGVSATAIHRWEQGRQKPGGPAALRYGAVLRALQEQKDAVAA